jgi:hypothetical protein
MPLLPYGRAIRLRLAADAKWRFCTRESLLGVLRVAVSLQHEAKVSEAEFFDPFVGADVFVRALLIANEVLSREIHAGSATGYRARTASLRVALLRSRPRHERKKTDIELRSA